MSNRSWKWWRRGEGLDGRHLIPHGHFALVITHSGAGSAGLARWHGTASTGGTSWSPRGAATTQAALPGAGPLALLSWMPHPGSGLGLSLRQGEAVRARLLPPAEESPGKGKAMVAATSSLPSSLLPLIRRVVLWLAWQGFVRRRFGGPRTQTRGKEFCWQRFLSSFSSRAPFHVM